MFTMIESCTADDLWLTAVDRFREGHSATQDSRAGATNELLHAALCLHNPRERWVVSREPALNPAFALAEVIWMLRGRNDSEFLTYFNSGLTKFAGDGPTFHGAYGFRLRHQMGIDQLFRAYQALRANPNSRQVVLQIWEAGTDLPLPDGVATAADIPCNVCALLKVRNGRLEWTQIMRSNDVFRGLPYNLVQFTSLQEIMAGWLGLGVGHYHHISDSLHIYEDTIADVFRAVSVDAPANCDSLAATYETTDAHCGAVERLICKIINASKSTEELVAEFEALEVSIPWRNVAALLVAEGLRKRRASTAMETVLTRCDNALFGLLFERWIARIGGTKKH